MADTEGTNHVPTFSEDQLLADELLQYLCSSEIFKHSSEYANISWNFIKDPRLLYFLCIPFLRQSPWSDPTNGTNKELTSRPFDFSENRNC